MFPLNLPNVLTLVRILLVPVLVVALLQTTPHGSTVAAIVFAVAAITDGVDGWIARRSRSITTFGKVMDPIADKLLIAAALISLVSLDRVDGWVAMVIIAREFAVSGLSREPLHELLAGRPADVERPVEGAVVHVEDGEQHVDRRDHVGAAEAGQLAGAVGHDLHHVLALRPAAQEAHRARLRRGLERRL